VANAALCTLWLQQKMEKRRGAQYKSAKIKNKNMNTYSTGKDIFTTISSIRCSVSFEQIVVCCAEAEFMNVQFR
jgi:hypothetical protein